MHPDFKGKIVGKVKLVGVILARSTLSRVWRSYTRHWTYLLRDNIFTRSIPVLCRSVMVSRHVVCEWKNAIRMCNKKHILGTIMIVWRE